MKKTRNGSARDTAGKDVDGIVESIRKSATIGKAAPAK